MSESASQHLKDQVAAGLDHETARQRVAHTPRRQIDGPQSHSNYLENHFLSGGTTPPGDGTTSPESEPDKRRHDAT